MKQAKNYDSSADLETNDPAAVDEPIAAHGRMRVTFRGIKPDARNGWQHCLDRAAELRCAEHGETITAVIINGRDNGSFDPIWITCCKGLDLQATALMKECI